MGRSISTETLRLSSSDVYSDGETLFINGIPLIAKNIGLENLEIEYSGSFYNNGFNFGPVIKILPLAKLYLFGAQTGYSSTGLWIENFEYYETGTAQGRELTFLKLKNLVGVQDNFSIYPPINFYEIITPELKIVGNNMTVTGRNFSAPKLEVVGNNLTVNLSSGANFNFSGLQSVGGILTTNFLTGITVANFYPNLKRVGAGIYHGPLVAVTGLVYPQLEFCGISGVIIPSTTQNLTYLSIPNYQRGSIKIVNGASRLSNINAPLWEFGELQANGNFPVEYIVNSGSYLSGITFPQYKGGGLSFTSTTPLRCVDLPLYTGSKEDIIVFNAVPFISGINFPNVIRLKKFSINQGQVDNINLSKLELIEQFNFDNINNNTTIKKYFALHLNSLKIVETNFDLTSLTLVERLTGFNFNALENISGRLTLSANSGVAEMSFPRLVTVGNTPTGWSAVAPLIDLNACNARLVKFDNLKQIGSGQSSDFLKPYYGIGGNTFNQHLTGVYLTGIEIIDSRVQASYGGLFFNNYGRLTGVYLGSGLKYYNGLVVNFAACALTKESIENILIAFSGLNGTAGKTLFSGASYSIVLNAGTNAPRSTWSPVASGAYNVLVARGVSISYN